MGPAIPVDSRFRLSLLVGTVSSDRGTRLPKRSLAILVADGLDSRAGLWRSSIPVCMDDIVRHRGRCGRDVCLAFLSWCWWKGHCHLPGVRSGSGNLASTVSDKQLSSA